MQLIKPKYPVPPPPAQHVFPTRHRDKHGKSVSFPIGAEKLSRALDGVPQHAGLGCRFFVGDIERRKMRETEHVLHVVYSRQLPTQHFAMSAAESGVFDPHWSITVFAVPTGIRHQVKTLLESALRERVKPWLIEHAGIENRPGQCALTIEFDTVNGALVFETTNTLLPERA